MFRGVSQTDEKPQVFGGADVSAGRFYAGVWASNVDFDDSTDAEFDLYAGFTPTLGVVSMDLSLLYYGYTDQPSGADLDYFELKAAGSVPLGPAAIGAQVYYSPNYYSGIDHALYYEINGAFSPTAKLSFSAAVGRQQASGPGTTPPGMSAWAMRSPIIWAWICGITTPTSTASATSTAAAPWSA